MWFVDMHPVGKVKMCKCIFLPLSYSITVYMYDFYQMEWDISIRSWSQSDPGLLCMQYAFLTLQQSRNKGWEQHVQHVMATQTSSWAKETHQQREGWKKRKMELQKGWSLPTGQPYSITRFFFSLLPPSLLFYCPPCPQTPFVLETSPVSCFPFLTPSPLFSFSLPPSPLSDRWPTWPSFPKTLVWKQKGNVLVCVSIARSHSFIRTQKELNSIQSCTAPVGCMALNVQQNVSWND